MISVVQIRDLASAHVATLRGMLPILVTLGVFEVLILGSIPEDPVGLFASFLAMLTGLTLMIRGLGASFFPIGEALAEAIGRRGDHFWLMGFAFALGFGSTIAEPALAAVAAEAAGVMTADPLLPVTEAQRNMLALQMRYGVAVGLGLALMLAVWRILKGWAISWLVLPLYGAVGLIALVSSSPLVGVALDAGTAATSIINIPLMLALGIGVASMLRGRNALVDGFGIVALASLMPTVLFLVVALLLAPGG